MNYHDIITIDPGKRNGKPCIRGLRMTVTDIYIKLRLEQSVASQHLAILRKAQIVNTTRNGKFIYYSLNPERLSHISSLVEELVQ